MEAPVRDPAAPKKSVNLSVNSDLLRQARDLKVNLSKALEEGLGSPERPPARALPYDPSAPKQAANLSINSDLLRRTRDLKVNLSKTLERRLVEIVREERARRWKEENLQAMEAFNRFIEKHGLFNDVRRWL